MKVVNVPQIKETINQLKKKEKPNYSVLSGYITAPEISLRKWLNCSSLFQA